MMKNYTSRSNTKRKRNLYSRYNRIFERFYRINKARSLKDGTGLGLALVKHTCKYYNFEINVDSRENIGTTFTIYLK